VKLTAENIRDAPREIARAALKVASTDDIIRLAYGEYAEDPLDGVPTWLARAAYDEMEDRE
jgi:hypothetical protein